ncbi:MAG: VOC family protein [Armatimonadota bacterium]
MITGIKHIAVAVRDVDQALARYEAVLGVDEVKRHRFEKARTNEAHFTLSGVQVQLCQSWDRDGRFARYITEHGDEGVHHVCYTVENIEQALADATTRGATLKPCAACKIIGPHKHSEGWVAFLEDRLAGMETEFMQVYKPGEGPDVGPRTV